MKIPDGPKKVREALESLLFSCSHKCRTIAIEREISDIADAYVNAWANNQRFQLPRFGLTNHYRGGQLCWQWMNIVYANVAPIIKSGSTFRIDRVGTISLGSNGERTLEHNRIAISLASSTSGKPNKDCVVYLDPWQNNRPDVFTGSEDNLHNFIDEVNDPNQAQGWYYPPEGGPVEIRLQRRSSLWFF